MLNPIITWPLTEVAGKSHSKKTQQQKIKKKQRKTYREVSGTTLKPRPDADGPAGQGPLPGYDPRPLTSVGAESSQPAPAWPGGHCDLWLRTRRPEQQAGHPLAVSHVLALVPATHGCKPAPLTAWPARPHPQQKGMRLTMPPRGAVTAPALFPVRRWRPHSQHASSAWEPRRASSPPAHLPQT